MPFRYMVFRSGYEFKKRTGLLKRRFPSNVGNPLNVSIEEWHSATISFFEWDFTNLPSLSEYQLNELRKQASKIEKGVFPYFTDQELETNVDDWHTNPLTGYSYDKEAHWTTLSDFDVKAGDIKYVWEKARFSWLYYLIRNDIHNHTDSSVFVFNTIESFIDNNPINKGPHYICSQEISIRVLNWVFALHYYAHSPSLTAEVFSKVLNSIFNQMRHVYSNINFSRIAVRNNHTLTETLTLYIVGLLFSEMPGAIKWKKKGKEWFEEEVAYQVYEDGSYLQYSMNYHRVVIQLLTWAITLSEKNKEHFADVVYERAKKSIQFLEACQDPVSGQLPLYGANDGALFFPLNSAEYRDYRPQIAALKSALNMPISNKLIFNALEELFWYGLKTKFDEIRTNQPSQAYQFTNGGYYSYKDLNTLTFIRCGSHKNRPSQADNLHLDLWVDGVNLLRDSGTFLYNGDYKGIAYFNSTLAHNTIQINDMDQMERGPRFVWFSWTKAIAAVTMETDEYWQFSGRIKAFGGMIHSRKVRRYKNKLVWEIEDKIENKGKTDWIHQHWHPNSADRHQINISCKTLKGDKISPNRDMGWYAPNYGIKEESPVLTFKTQEDYLITRIEVNL